MRCNAVIERVQRRTKGAGHPVSRVHLQTSAYWFRRYVQEPELRTGEVQQVLDRFLSGQYTRCAGQIQSQVRALEEPYFGGVSAVCEVTHTCLVCGNTHFPDLPQDATAVSELLTRHVAALNDPYEEEV